ncbi:MAG: adenylate/guanylate cyclase domain-containing protein [Roseiarcus sp.]|uniref:adenylate/guanylate cyclase domain-containing protein n=1 Tax=Roseiarcus sp. TaxID=1969460 RepID=UPI003BB002D8
MLHPSPLRRPIWIVVIGALIGVLYGDLHHGTPIIGGCVGGAMGAAFFSLERFVLRRNSGWLFGRLPFLPYLALRTALYAAVIFVVNAIAIMLASGRFMTVGSVDFLSSFLVVVGFNLLFSVNDLLGPGALFAFAAGRYYHPRIEERALLFIDMRSSTAIAERLGELRFLDLLNRFITDVSLAVAEAGGEIHKYVGDEVIATWRLAPGPNEPACVRACFSALDRIRAEAPAYEREFALVPDFRAGLHCGPIAVGELGYLKKEIALIGDAMNTVARIVESCRAADARVLASAALIDRLAALPPHVTKRRLGELPMRGKQQPLELYVLEEGGG